MDLFENLPELLKFSATLGVGGLLAFAMFLFYRKDQMANSEAWRGQSEVLIAIVKENTAAISQLQASTTALQTSVGALVSMIEALRHEMTEREISRLRDER